jgi:FAD/FMN-containing dehydrogenase
VLGGAFERGFVEDAVLAGSPAQRRSLWALREGISEAQNHEGPSLKHDVAVPIRALPDFLHATSRAIERIVPGIRLVTYGHVGDGNLHHNLSKPVGGNDVEFLGHAEELARTLYDHVAAAGGSISAEHGLGTAKRDAAAVYKPPVELDIMRDIKAVLDPHGLMNPGKVL